MVYPPNFDSPTRSTARLRSDHESLSRRGDQRWIYVTPLGSATTPPDYVTDDPLYPPFEDGWGNVDATRVAASFRLHAGNWQLRLAVTGGEGTPGSTIFTIPSTYPRPAVILRYVVAIGSDGSGIGTIDLHPDGIVEFVDQVI